MVLDEKDDREVHMVGMVVTKEWRKAKSAEAGICIRFSCRDNSSFRLNSLGPLCLWQCFVLSLEQGSVIVGSLRRLGGDISVKGAAGWD